MPRVSAGIHLIDVTATATVVTAPMNITAVSPCLLSYKTSSHRKPFEEIEVSRYDKIAYETFENNVAIILEF